jgi:hypothetical protein
VDEHVPAARIYRSEKRLLDLATAFSGLR